MTHTKHTLRVISWTNEPKYAIKAGGALIATNVHPDYADQFAAAPELLAAAKAIAKWLGRDIEDWDSLRAAIAKAEGK